jgi:hypothetical protein
MSLSKRVFKPENRRALLLTSSILILLVLGVVLAVLAFRKPTRDVEPVYSNRSVLTSADFMLSEEEPEYTQPRYYLFREQKQKWDQEMIMPYWYPISEILTDIISKRNDEKVEAILKP